MDVNEIRQEIKELKAEKAKIEERIDEINGELKANNLTEAKINELRNDKQSLNAQLVDITKTIFEYSKRLPTGTAPIMTGKIFYFILE